jgi:acyl-coenzyme A thioesterase PaaI-like protein
VEQQTRIVFARVAARGYFGYRASLYREWDSDFAKIVFLHVWKQPNKRTLNTSPLFGFVRIIPIMSTSYLKLKDFLRLTARLEHAHPGFGASYLGLGVDNVTLHPPSSSSAQNRNETARSGCTLVTPNNHTPVILHTPSSSLSVQPQQSQPLCKVQIPCASPSSFLLSEYLAQIDEITTWELVLKDDQRNRAGVSVQLHAQWNHQHMQHHHSDHRIGTKDDSTNTNTGMVVEVIPNVLKIGRNLAFVDAQVVVAGTMPSVASSSSSMENTMSPTHSVLAATASHIKYMPMGFVTDMALRNWKLLQRYSQYWLSSSSSSSTESNTTVANNNHRPKTRTDLLECLEYPSHPPPVERMDSTSTFQATFHILPWHASLGGPIHGGCQAILMELVAQQAIIRIAQPQQVKQPHDQDASSSSFRLHAMTVDYLSPPMGCETVQITATLFHSHADNEENEPIRKSNSPTIQQRHVLVEIRDTQRTEKLYSRGTLLYDVIALE